MYIDEKAIIFSRYIDVLYAYFNLCNDLGIPSIIITGMDKEKQIREKSHHFRYTASTRVLLTTLQKSSEGFNFEIATHLIILELW
jgi:SNF2 family DNA or RNA helicase